MSKFVLFWSGTLIKLATGFCTAFCSASSAEADAEASDFSCATTTPAKIRIMRQHLKIIALSLLMTSPVKVRVSSPTTSP